MPLPACPAKINPRPFCRYASLPRDGQLERGIASANKRRTWAGAEAPYKDRARYPSAVGGGADSWCREARCQPVDLDDVEPAVHRLDVAARPVEADLILPCS